MSTEETTIARDELADAIASGAVAVLDAQGAGWFERERLPGAIRARPQDLAGLERRLPAGKRTPVVVYCWSETCVASEWTAQHLVELGYRHIRRYVGGKLDWMRAGLPVEGEGE